MGCGGQGATSPAPSVRAQWATPSPIPGVPGLGLLWPRSVAWWKLTLVLFRKP